MATQNLQSEGTSAAHFVLGYFQHVLGVRAWPRPVFHRPQLLILDIPWPQGLHQEEMFQKMMVAIGLTAKDFDVLECLPGELSRQTETFQDRQIVLSFSQELSESLRDIFPEGGGPEVMTTWGPRDLREHPEKKRETWQILKGIQKTIQGRVIS